MEETAHNDPGFNLPRFTMTDVLKIIGVIVFVAATWARQEMGLSQLKQQLDKMDNVFVRQDVETANQATLAAKLDALKLELERVEMKLDK